MFKMTRKIKAGFAVVCALALFMAGTFAWEQIINHVNEFTGKRDDVTMHDDFDPSTGQKDVYVENQGSKPIFIRVKLNEAMNLTSYTWRPAAGDWTTHTYGTTAENCGHANAAGKLFHDYFKWTMGGWKYYVPAAGLEQIVHDTRTYTETDFNAGTAKKTPDAVMITAAGFLAMTPEQQADFIGWIYDTDGYAYWSQPLNKGEVTGLLLHKVTTDASLKNTDYYYAIDVIVEAVDIDDIPMWTQGAQPSDGGTKHPEATEQGKEVIGIITGNAGGTTNPGGGGNPGEPDGDRLPINTPADGFTPFYDEEDPDNSNSFFGKFNYFSSDIPSKTIFHFGSIHLEDVFTDGDYNYVTAAAADAKYADFITIGDDRHGKPSIIYSYEPTKQEWSDFLTAKAGDTLIIPIQVELARGGRSAVITVNMTYHDCLVVM